MVVKVTAQQVAERAGVSQSAVSRVFTPGASVSEQMAHKVREAAKALGYRPNVLARAMASGRSRIIGLVVAYLDNYFYPEAIEKLSNALQEQGYQHPVLPDQAVFQPPEIQRAHGVFLACWWQPEEAVAGQ